jgi:hypothetical protein
MIERVGILLQEIATSFYVIKIVSSIRESSRNFATFIDNQRLSPPF